MRRDIYLYEDGEVEAEHVWVNEWADGVRVRIEAPALDLPEPAELLLRDMAEIKLARDALARDETASPNALARLRHMLKFGR